MTALTGPGRNAIMDLAPKFYESNFPIFQPGFIAFFLLKNKEHIFFRRLCENKDVVKEIEKGKLKRGNVGMPLAVFIERNNLQYNTDLQILR